MTSRSTSNPNDYARRALGRRPGPAPPELHVEGPPFDQAPTSYLAATPTPASPRNRSLSIAIPISPTHVTPPVSPSGAKRFRRPTISRKRSPNPVEVPKGLVETRKLLAHLLDRLQSSKEAPDLLNLANARATSAGWTSGGKGSSKGTVGRLGQVMVAAAQSGIGVGQHSTFSSESIHGSDEEEDGNPMDKSKWDTEPTYELLDQTRGLLVLAHRQGLDLFSGDAGTTGYLGDHLPTPTKPRKLGPRLSSFTSPIATQKPAFPDVRLGQMSDSVSARPLLDRLLDLLQVLSIQDSLHHVSRFRLMVPPKALQAASLDIASVIYSNSDLAAKIRTMEIVIGSLSSNAPSMTERLCQWLEGRLGDVLEMLERERSELASYHSGRLSPTPLGLHKPSEFAIRLGALIPKSIVALSPTIRSSSASLSTVHRAHRIISRLLTGKPDCALDLLQIVAFSSRPNREVALSLLSTYYSRLMGHNTIARRFPEITYNGYLHSVEGTSSGRAEDGEDHHYIPWRISSNDPVTTPHNRCLTCESEIHGFCLKCTFCHDVRHVHCLQTPDEVMTYDVIRMSTSKTQTAHVKYSRCPPRLDEKVLDGTSARGTAQSTRRLIGQHDFHLVNLFTLTNCESCREPLWGTLAQAYACTNGCQRFYHPTCVDRIQHSGNAACRPGQHVVIDDITNNSSDPFRIHGATLQTSADRHLAPFCHSASDLTHMSYDEVAILYGHLWVQQKILETGLATGTVYVIDRDKSRSRSDPLGLRSFIKGYENYLNTNSATASPAASDFVHASNATKPLAQGYLFSRRFMTYCIALIRSPPDSGSGPDSQDLLNPFGDSDITEATQGAAAEGLSLTKVKTALAIDMTVRDPSLARVLLNQLNALNLCTISRQPFLRDDEVPDGSTWMSFGLPLVMDASPSVEILITAIETLLDDVDLSHNEQAMLLLSNRAWPSLHCSPYALERIAGAVASWVMHEDHYLLQVVKKYASQNKSLPGVREMLHPIKGYQGSSSVALYKEDRGRLLTQYASPWLRALHDEDFELYSNVIYEQCQKYKELQPPGGDSDDEAALRLANHALDRLTVAAEAQILYSSHLEVTVAWLEDLGVLGRKDHLFRALPRLIGAGHTWNTEETADIWSHARTVSHEPDGLAKVCLWLRILTFSGVEVPWEMISHAIESVKCGVIPLEAVDDLLHAVGNNTTSIPAERLAELSCEMFCHLCSVSNKDKAQDSETMTIKSNSIRHGLVLVLKAHGVPIEEINSLSPNDGDVNHGSVNETKRKRLTLPPRQFELSAETVSQAASLLRNPTYPSQHILDFIWLLSTKATLAANVDGFLYELGPKLFEMIWPQFDFNANHAELMRIMLRLLSVNAKDIEAIVSKELSIQVEVCQERLLNFALLLSSVDDVQGGTHSRSSAVGLIMILLRSLIHPSGSNPHRMVILDSLLPTHLAALSRCFADHLARASDERRVAILCELQRFRTVLPSWPILSWSTIEDLLAEQVAAVSQMTSWRKSQPVSAMVDTQMVRSCLVAIALDMLSTGIEISWPMAQRLQQHVAAACALPWPVPNEGIVNLVLPALRQVLDSSQRISTSGQGKKSVLVGALFVPVVIDFGNELRKHDFLTQRCLLDILMVTLYKQDVKVVELAALGTLQTIADYVALPGSTENRLLAIQILQTAVSRIDIHSFLRVSPSIFTVILTAYIEQIIESGDPAIIDQCRNLLRVMIKTFGRLGLFVQVFKNDSMNSSWSHSKSQTMFALRRLMMEETGTTILDSIFADLADTLKRDHNALQHVLDSLATFVAGLDMELSEAASDNFSSLLNRVCKHVAEWDVGAFAPGSMLDTCRYLLDHVPPASVETLLHQTATLLMLSLSRFHTPFESVQPLLHVAGRIASREGIINTPQSVVYDTLRTGLQHGDMSAISILAVLRCLTSSDTMVTDDARRAIIEASQGCMAILNRSHPIVNTHTRLDPEVSLDLFHQASELLMQADGIQAGFIGQLIQALPEQAAQVRCEMFIHLIAASASNASISSLYPVIARATSLCLRGCGDHLSVTDTSGTGADMLSTSFNITRLVLLGDEKEAIAVFWSRTWPDWQRLLNLSLEAHCVNAPLQAVSQSVFLDLVIYLKTIDSPLLTDTRESILQNLALLEVTSTAGAKAKLQKAKQCLETSVGTELSMVDVEGVRKGVWGDILASEKLKALRIRK